MNAVAGCEGAGPIGGVDVFVCGARWRNEAGGTAPLRAKAGVRWHARSRLGNGICRNEASGNRFLRARLGDGILRNEATFFLQLAQNGEGFVETAFGGGHHALDGGEMRDPDLVGIEERSFDCASAAQAPELFGHFVHQDFLGLVDWLLFVAEFDLERVQCVRAFGRKRKFFGRQSVLREIEPHTLGASHEGVRRASKIGRKLLRRLGRNYFAIW
jgi:hypothetical protein